MFDIYNKEGVNIARVTEGELYRLRKEGYIKPSDKIYDSITGEKLK